MENVKLPELFAAAAKKFSLDIRKYEVAGEKLRSELGLKYHTAFLCHYDKGSSSVPFPMTKINKITPAFRNEIVYQDLTRRDNKRNFTLTLEGKRLIFITKNPEPTYKEWVNKDGVTVDNTETIKEWQEKSIEEKIWIDKFLRPTNYSTVIQSEIPKDSTSSYTWEEKEEVSVPLREVSPEGTLTPFSPTWYRSDSDFEQGRSFCYVVVKTLEEAEFGMSSDLGLKMAILQDIVGLTPVLISKSRLKYFSDKRHVEFTDALFEKYTGYKKNIAILTGYVNSNSAERLHDNSSYSFCRLHLQELIPAELMVNAPRKGKEVPYWSNRIPRVIDSIKKTDLLTIWEEHKKVLYSEMPLLRFFNLDSYWNRPEGEVIEDIKMYVELKRKS